MSGTLSMRICEAQNLKSHTTLSTMDPFVKVSVNNQQLMKTKTHPNFLQLFLRMISQETSL